MSRSVSAPSSVTNTSPCWNGLIVPGSTFRYGSNFCSATRRPLLSSRQPMLDAAIPLPSDETTPPVTKMHFGILMVRCQAGLAGGHLKHSCDTLQIVGGIHPEGIVFGLRNADREAVFERAKLFQALRLLERANRQIRITKEKIPAVYV